YPIATAHAIGLDLQRRSRLPWFADFRDPMVQEGYPADPATWRAFKVIETETMRQAAHVIFVTRGAARAYAERHRGGGAGRIAVIENGFDEESFSGIDRQVATAGPLAADTITLLHSGVVYTSERDPTQFFQALGHLKRERALGKRKLLIRFRASSNDGL